MVLLKDTHIDHIKDQLTIFHMGHYAILTIYAIFEPLEEKRPLGPETKIVSLGVAPKL